MCGFLRWDKAYFMENWSVLVGHMVFPPTAFDGRVKVCETAQSLCPLQVTIMKNLGTEALHMRKQEVAIHAVVSAVHRAD